MYQQILARLEEAGVSFAIHEHEISRTYADAIERLSFPKERLLKTVVFRTRRGEWVLAALRGEDRVDYRSLAAALGVRREDVLRASPEEVLEILGVEVGAVGPISPNAAVKVLFDESINTSESVFCGVGRPDRTLEIRLADLVRLTNGQILRISQNAVKS